MVSTTQNGLHKKEWMASTENSGSHKTKWLPLKKWASLKWLGSTGFFLTGFLFSSIPFINHKLSFRMEAHKVFSLLFKNFFKNLFAKFCCCSIVGKLLCLHASIVTLKEIVWIHGPYHYGHIITVKVGTLHKQEKLRRFQTISFRVTMMLATRVWLPREVIPSDLQISSCCWANSAHQLSEVIKWVPGYTNDEGCSHHPTSPGR